VLLSAPSAHRAVRATATRPNIVFILTDNQRWDTLAGMPKVRSNLVDRGVKFSDALVENPWCCPSRASILTGQYSHTTGVYTNTSPDGGFPAFNDRSTIATWLRNSGYATALVGKYLNGYGSHLDRCRCTYIPPGWDRWVGLKQLRRYYDYSVNIDGDMSAYGSDASDYVTDVLATKADSFIRSVSPTKPLFLYFAPTAPHLPAIPAPRHATAFADLRPWRPPSYNEANMADKPTYMRALPLLTSSTNVDEFRRRQYRSLLAVDDAVGRLIQALKDTGRLTNTMVIFASDNGYLWGEHRWKSKVGGMVVPYDESLRIPLVIRFDRLTTDSRNDGHLVANVDFAPTLADLAGVGSPGAQGTSLLPLLADTSVPWRKDLLIEHVKGPGDSWEETVPTYCGVRSKAFTYVVYATGEEELYDLSADRYQLTNVVDDPSYASTVTAMRARVRQLCNPTPPGFTFSK
jgi:N-acetylglucosamine-6-sulfatase